jgi:hypothetical protein
MFAQVQAFMKLFLKFSERKAYRMGFMAEFEYDRHPASSITATMTLSWNNVNG